MKRWSVLLLLGCISAALISTAHADVLESIRANKVVKIAVLDDYPPWGSVGPDMKVQGYDVDTAELIGKKLGVEVQLVPTTGHNRIPYLQTGKVDLIVACLGKNPDREKVIDFSQPYGYEFNGVFGDENTVVSKPEDLVNQRIGVARGSSEDLVLTRIAPKEAKILRFEDGSGSVSAFFAGQVDLVAIGSSVASELIKGAPARVPHLKLKLAEEPAYIGLSKNEPKLMAEVKRVISEAKADGSLNALSLKWLQTPLPSDSAEK